MAKKNIKIKPVFIVNLTDENIHCAEEVADAFTVAKIRAGLPITIDEYNTAIRSSMDLVATFIQQRMEDEAKYVYDIFTNIIKQKKDPWYKRIWKRIMRK